MAVASEPGGVSLPVAGIVIAVVSSFINGSTFVLQRKGILRSRDRGRRTLALLKDGQKRPYTSHLYVE